MLIYYYPTCGTVKKALKWLDKKNLSYDKRHIVEETMTEEELKSYYQKSGLSLKRFLNTSGKVYREMDLKSKKDSMSDDEIIKLLVTNPMLLKRPIVVAEEFVLVGFKEAEYEKAFGGK